MQIQKDFIVKIKPTHDAIYENLQGKLTPRLLTQGVVLHVSPRGWVLVNMLDKSGRSIFKECFWQDELDIVSFKEQAQKNITTKFANGQLHISAPLKEAHQTLYFAANNDMYAS